MTTLLCRLLAIASILMMLLISSSFAQQHRRSFQLCNNDQYFNRYYDQRYNQSLHDNTDHYSNCETNCNPLELFGIAKISHSSNNIDQYGNTDTTSHSTITLQYSNCNTDQDLNTDTTNHSTITPTVIYPTRNQPILFGISPH